MHRGGIELADAYRSIVERAAEAIIVVDRDGAIQAWNHGAEAIFGFAAAEVLGGSLDVIIPERFRRAHGAGFRRAIESGQIHSVNKVLTTRSAHKNGSKLYVELSFGLVCDPAGSVAGAFAIGRDCTARFASDAALRTRLSDLETRLATTTAASSAPAPALMHAEGCIAAQPERIDPAPD